MRSSSRLDAKKKPYIPQTLPLGGVGWKSLIGRASRATHRASARERGKGSRHHCLYERLKVRVLKLTRSQYAVPMLDVLFARPILRSSDFESRPGLPSKQMIMTMISKLKQDQILKVVRAGSGRRAQVLALAELINLCEARTQSRGAMNCGRSNHRPIPCYGLGSTQRRRANCTLRSWDCFDV
jgi:hypothetical protein